MRVASALLVTGLLGCSEPSPSGATGTAPRRLGSAGGRGGVEASAAPTASAPSCAPPVCRLFDAPEAALTVVIDEARPVVLAFGEAHAQRGTEQITSATTRFGEQLLPRLRGRASDLVVELVAASDKCGESKKQVAEVQKPVTRSQATSNQGEFVTLGSRARGLGIEPWVLRPSCAELARVGEGGAEGLDRMLTLIARLTEQQVARAIGRNRAARRDAMVVTYGGALHNDLSPRPGREPWSFGPELVKYTAGRYVEIDLIVPEYVEDNDSWRRQAWYPHYRRGAYPTRTTLLRPSPGSYALVFPETERPPPGSASGAAR